MDSHAGFSRNLDRLSRLKPQLARAIGAASSEGIEHVAGPRGLPSLRERGVLLASAYDPVGEGRRMAARMAAEPADLIVAIGAGLGHHLEQYRAEHSCPVLVYEPSLGRMRAALGANTELGCFALDAVDWTWELDDFADRFRALYRSGLRVQTFVHPVLRRLDPDSVHAALTGLARTKDACDLAAATQVRMSVPWAEVTAFNTPHLLRTPNFARLSGAFAGVPAVIVAAGPSLDKQLPHLAAVSDRVLVIGIGQTLRALKEAGIQPHLVHVIESQDVAHQIELAGDPEEVSLVVVPSVNPSLFGLPVSARFVAYPVTNPLGRWISGALGDETWCGGGATVAQSAVRLAHSLGADPVMLIGQDLAFTDGRTYGSNTTYDMLKLREADDGGLVYTHVHEKSELFGSAACEPERAVDLVYVDGWDGEPVATSKSYATFIEHYGKIAAELEAQGTRLVNCTEGGARIPGLAHVPFREALENCEPKPLDARGRIRAAADLAATKREGAQTLRAALGHAGSQLDRIDRQARSALNGIRKLRDGLKRKDPRELVGALRRIQRRAEKLRESIAALPWVEELVAARVHEIAVELRKTAGSDPSVDDSLDESEALFEVTRRAVGSARELTGLMRTRSGDSVGR